MKSNATNIYRWVVDDVITKMKPEFVQEGADESTLLQLRVLWQKKLEESGILNEDETPETEAATIKDPIKDEGEEKEDEEEDGGGPSVGLKRQRDEEGPSSGSVSKRTTGQTRIQDVHKPVEKENCTEGRSAEAEAHDDTVLSEDESENESEDEQYGKNFLCAQFDRVNRTKSRWKVVMRDGVFHLNGKDYLFRKATSEFIF